ncbi:OCIA domain-containing protein 1 isoform X2 [Vanacampus margaritifer]
MSRGSAKEHSRPWGYATSPRRRRRGCSRSATTKAFALPFSVVSMAVTQALVARGTLSASPKFGSIPKVVFAGFCGYLAGKISYMKTCQEKFKRLDNSRLGEALRQGTGLSSQPPKGAQSELSDPDLQNYESMLQPAETPASTMEHGYGINPEASSPTWRTDDFNVPAQSLEEENEPKRKSILYEDLRQKNRENYEVTLTQKAESLLKTSPVKEPQRPTKSGKKNIYGDTWEE